MVSVIKFIEFILSSKQKQDDNREKILYIYIIFFEKQDIKTASDDIKTTSEVI